MTAITELRNGPLLFGLEWTGTFASKTHPHASALPGLKVMAVGAGNQMG
jgi:hypothetical protein